MKRSQLDICSWDFAAKPRRGFCPLFLQQIVLILNIAAHFIAFEMNLIKSFSFYVQTVLNFDRSVHYQRKVYFSGFVIQWNALVWNSV
jgi:hypothetical protein